MSAPTSATCPNCHAPASGKFCSDCGAPLAGASCGACGSPLTPGAKFCHRCGATAGAGTAAATGAESGGFAAALPWAVAAIALVALIALVAGQRFAHRPSAAAGSVAATDQGAPADQSGAPFGAGMRAPDISNMSPSERASRLYDRIMSYSEQGKTDSVQIFAPMAVAAYEMLGTLTPDQRYDLGRIGSASGDLSLAKAEADTLLSTNPKHLLGLILAAQVAAQSNDDSGARAFMKRLATAAPSELATRAPEYVQHRNEIDAAVADAKKQ